MNILHLIAPISFGGGESLLINLLQEKSCNFRESVALIYSSSIFESKLVEISIPCWILQEKSIGYGISKWDMALSTIKDLLVIKKIINIIKTEKIDLIHAHGYPASLIVYIIKYLLKINIKSIYTHHSYRQSPNYVERILLSNVYSSFDFCVGVSDLVSQSMNDAFPRLKQKFKTIYNCVGNTFFANNTSKSQNYRDIFPSDKIVFVQIGRFVKCKNHMLVVQSINKLTLAERDNIFVVFVGEGSEKEKVADFVQSNALESQVCFLGAVAYEKIPEILSSANFGLFPSENEGFGIAAVECLALGLPVLSLDTKLMKEIIGYAGLQVRHDNFHNGFSEIMEKFSNGSELARQRAEIFRPNLIKKQYQDLYLKALGGVSK